MNKLFENEHMFEQANAKVAAVTSSLAPEHFPKDFALELYCECANKRCLERVSITYEEYKQAKKAGAASFVVKPEHYLPEFERLVSKAANYWTIEKRLEKLSKPFEV